MSESPPHPHGTHAEHGPDGSWSGRAERYVRMAELIEPTLTSVTGLMLDQVKARAGTRLLDLACGPGHSTAAANHRGADALGIDVTPAMVDAARRRYPLVRFQVGDMLNPPPGPWDAIICRFGVHHVDPSWATAVHRVLAEDGRLAIAELAPRDQKSRDSGMRTAEHWTDLLASSGFKDVRVGTVTLTGQGLAPHSGLQPLTDHDASSPFDGGTAYVVSGQKPAT